MKIITGFNVRTKGAPCVLALGMFDGVHTGHRELIDTAVREAVKRDVRSAVLTFDKTPAQALFPERNIQLLTTLQERSRRMALAGMDYMYMLPFDRKTADIPADTFLEWVLGTMNPVCVVAGYDYSFGRGGSGDTQMLRSYLTDRGVDVIVLPAVYMGGAPVSSTRIRIALGEGRLDDANAMLGYPYSMTGTVVEGKHLGIKLGYPTANIEVSGKKQLPSFGVYTCYLETKNEVLKAVVNIGTQPTVPSGKVTVEAFVLEGEHELRGQKVRISLQDRLRPEIRFKTLEDLAEQIGCDAEEAKRRLG